MSNPLLEPFTNSHHSAPFSKVKEEHFLPAFTQLIDEAEKEINEIVENPVEPTFENTIEALAFTGEKLDLISHLFFNLNSAETNEELQNIAQEISPLLSAFSSKISQNQKLFERIKTVYDTKPQLQFDAEQMTLLDETYKGFVRSGALLNDDDKKILEDINKDLSLKSLQFGQNVLASSNAYFKNVKDVKDLAGIPEGIIEQYKAEAEERDLEGYVITLDYPSYLPAVTYAENRSLRAELSLANGKKSFDGGDWDNQNLVKELIQLKQKKAELLGFKNYATYVLEERMAQTPEKVFEFLKELAEKAKPFAEKEIQQLKELAEKEGISDIQTYDHAFYAEKLRKQKFDLNDEELKPYFPLEKVQDAVFNLAKKLFDLDFKETDLIEKYHQDVKTYEISENGKFKALLYADYFPRKGKRAGAWMTSFKNQYIKNNENTRPHISVVCNFSKPTKTTPSLLTFQEVTTLFHEFGHALHGVLADTTYPNLSGTSVKWDFVELPSQFLENYCYEPEFLKTFAKHYETGEILSDEKIEKLAASKNFMEGYQTFRQIGFALLDMKYHTEPDLVENIKQFEEETLKNMQLYPTHPKTAMSPSFSHIFAGGYSAGYYSYKWAEVLDADAFQYFKEQGIFNPEITAKYKQLLASGGSKDPMELYKNFRGSEPNVESLLKRAFG